MGYIGSWDVLANFQSSLRPVLRKLLLSILALTFASSPSFAPGAQEERALLQLIINLEDRGEVLVVIKEGDVMARVLDLERAGLRGFSGKRETIRGEAYVSLSALSPTVTFELDQEALALRLTAQPELLGSTVLELRQARPSGLIYGQDTSAFLNYSINWQDLQRYDIFGEAAVSLKGNLLFTSVSRNSDGTVVRGLTNLTLDDRENLRRWVIGDRFVTSGGLGGSLLFAGISASRDFTLDPYFFPYPTLALSDALTTPSTVEIYVNDLLLRREKLSPGQVELKNLPVPAGSGVTRVVIRDAFGREREVISPFYFSTGVLARGLQEYSYNLGFRRKNLGIANGDYGPLAFLARHRVGLTDTFAAGLRLETARGLISGGPSINLRLPIGEVEFSAAASREESFGGAAASFAYIYRGRPFSFGGSVRALGDHYSTLGLKASDERTQWETSVFIGFQGGPRTNFFLQHTLANSHSEGKTQRVSLSSSIRIIDRLNLFLAGRHSREPKGKVNEIFLGLSYFLGTTTASISYEKRGSLGTGTMELQQSLPVGSGFGYRLQAAKNSDQHQGSALLQYQGPYGRYEASYFRVNQEDTTTLSTSGGLVTIGGGVHFTRPVQDSFGLIRVPGVAGVRGYASNQEVGRTDSRGDLLVPNLLSYYGNPLRIADEDIPLDYRVDATEKTIAAPYRGGAVVAFPVARVQSLTGILLLEVSGKPVTPAYGQLTVTVAGKKWESPIGRQGEFYLEDVPAGSHPAVLEYKEAVCRFTLEVPSSEDRVIKLGTLRCAVP